MRASNRTLLLVLLALIYPIFARAIEPGKITCESVLRVEQVRESLIHMRGLDLPETIPCDRIDSGLSADLLSQDFKANYTEDKLKILEELYYKFTLEEASYNYNEIRPFFIFVGGFYIPQTHNVFIVEIDPFVKMMREFIQNGGGEIDFDKLRKLDKDRTDYQGEEFVMIHEFTHAAQDLNFDLSAMDAYAEGNSDMDLAFDAVVEGEASWLAFEYEAHVKGIGQSAYRDFTDVLDDLTKQWREQEDYDKSSEFNMMLGSIVSFPYLQGQAFMQHARRTYGFEYDNEIFTNPPQSSEQILHPEKYFDSRDQPTDIDLSPLREYLSEFEENGVSVVHEDTMGEFGMRGILNTILPAGKAIDATTGWDGDRYIGFYDEDKELQIVWFTVWDNEDEAEEFLKIYKKYAVDKNIRLKRVGDAGESGGLYETSYGYVYFERRGSEAAIIDMYTLDGDIEDLIAALWACPRSEREPWEREITPPDEREISFTAAGVESEIKKAKTLAASGHARAASDILNILYENDVLQGDNMLQAGMLFAQSGQTDRALEIIDELRMNPENEKQKLEMDAARVDIFIKMQNLEEAETAFDQAFLEYDDMPNLISLMFRGVISLEDEEKDVLARLLRDAGAELLEEGDAYSAEAAIGKAAGILKDDADLKALHKEAKQMLGGKTAGKFNKSNIRLDGLPELEAGDELILFCEGEEFARVRVTAIKEKSAQVRVMSILKGYEVKDYDNFEVADEQ